MYLNFENKKEKYLKNQNREENIIYWLQYFSIVFSCKKYI